LFWGAGQYSLFGPMILYLDSDVEKAL
jgi:hypothetical protein